MFLKNITFNQDISFESTREDHKKKFKVKTKRYTEDNRRKPIYAEGSIFGRHIAYEKIKIVEKSFIIFNKGLSINFKPITIIVGDNGCGKSSLLKNLKPPKETDKFYFSFDKSSEELYKEDLSKWISNEDRTLKFIDNPEYFIVEQNIHKNSFLNAHKNNTDNSGYMKPQSVLDMWNMQTDSNGENTIDFLNRLKEVKNSFIVLDEPETSLSIKTQLKIKKLLLSISKNNNQLIIVTHNPLFMELSNEVYDFEVKQWVNTKNYINNQYN